MWGGSKLSSSGRRFLGGLRAGFRSTQADSSRLTTSAGECVCVSVCVCVRVALAEPFERTDLRRRGRGRPAVSVRAGWAKNLSSALLLPVCWAPGLGCYPPFPRGWEKELRPRGPGGGERRPRGPPPYIQWPLSYFRWAPSLGAGDKLCLPESQGLQLFFFCLSEKGHQLSYTYLSYCICVLFAHILPLPPFPQSIRQLHCFFMNRLIQETAKIKKKKQLTEPDACRRQFDYLTPSINQNVKFILCMKLI